MSNIVHIFWYKISPLSFHYSKLQMKTKPGRHLSSVSINFSFYGLLFLSSPFKYVQLQILKIFYSNQTFFCTFSNKLILWWSSLNFVRELRDFLCIKCVCRSNVAEILTFKMWQKPLYIRITTPTVQEIEKIDISKTLKKT